MIGIPYLISIPIPGTKCIAFDNIRIVGTRARVSTPLGRNYLHCTCCARPTPVETWAALKATIHGSSVERPAKCKVQHVA